LFALGGQLLLLGEGLTDAVASGNLAGVVAAVLLLVAVTIARGVVEHLFARKTTKERLDKIWEQLDPDHVDSVPERLRRLEEECRLTRKR